MSAHGGGEAAPAPPRATPQGSPPATADAAVAGGDEAADAEAGRRRRGPGEVGRGRAGQAARSVRALGGDEAGPPRRPACSGGAAARPASRPAAGRLLAAAGRRPAASTTSARSPPTRRPSPGWPPAPLRVNPADLGRLGLASGDRVRVVAAAGPRSWSRRWPTRGAPGRGRAGVQPARRPRRRPHRRRRAGHRRPGARPLGDAVLRGDPLFVEGVDLEVFLFVVVKALVGFAFVLVGVIFMIWFERKLIADMQNRVGPEPGRPLRPAPDPGRRHQADLQGGRAARPGRPSGVPAGAVPLGRLPPSSPSASSPSAATSRRRRRHDQPLRRRRPTCRSPTRPSGSCSCWPCRRSRVYGVMLAGWSSGSKYPLLGSVRASAQMVSYEAALGLRSWPWSCSTGSLSTHDIVASQAGGVSRLERRPHRRRALRHLRDRRLRRAQPAAVRPRRGRAGAGRRLPHRVLLDPLRLFYLAEFMNTITMSAIIVTLFFGGPAGPFGCRARLLWASSGSWPSSWSSCSSSSGSGPRCPASATTSSWTSGWKRLIPVCLGWLLLIAAIRIGRDENWFGDDVVNAAAIVGVCVALGPCSGVGHPLAKRPPREPGRRRPRRGP